MPISKRLSCKVIFAAFFVYFTTVLLYNSGHDNLQYASTPDIFVPPMQDCITKRDLKTFNKTALKTFNKSELKTSDELIMTKLNGNYLVNLSHTIKPDSIFDINNYGKNLNLVLNKTRYRDVPQNSLKKILFWNDAYGEKIYSIGVGNQPFYTYKCPDTRCYTTADRSALKSIGDFDAIVMNQRSIRWFDMPKQSERRPEQYYIMWAYESPAYPGMDIHQLDNYFNWTMTYRRDSDFPFPYGRVVQTKKHPPFGSPELAKIIDQFGKDNTHLARNRTGAKAAWFVSNCGTQSKRENLVKELQKYIPIQVFGKCTKSFHSNAADQKYCDRSEREKCYQKVQTEYKFYLSFENSLCKDYVTEKFFKILKDDIIPVTLNGVNMSEIAPPHSYISYNSDFNSPHDFAKHLENIAGNDTLYASYFWWRDYYEIRNSQADRAQSFCNLCSRLNDLNKQPKIYNDMYSWWVQDASCKKYDD